MRFVIRPCEGGMYKLIERVCVPGLDSLEQSEARFPTVEFQLC